VWCWVGHHGMVESFAPELPCSAVCCCNVVQWWPVAFSHQELQNILKRIINLCGIGADMPILHITWCHDAMVSFVTPEVKHDTLIATRCSGGLAFMSCFFCSGSNVIGHTIDGGWGVIVVVFFI